MTLTEFLLFRIAEDEATAAGEMLAEMGVTIEMRDKTASMLGYLGPTHVLAECEAKRQIVKLHSGADGAEWYGADDPPLSGLACTTCGTGSEYAVAWPCLTICALALPYSDHEDFQGEWRP